MTDECLGRVVIVDDDCDVRLSLQSIISESGYEAYAFDNGDDALSYLVDQGTDLVLTDIRMPGMSGMELLDSILAVKADIPVILMTAFADINVTVTAIKIGAFDFILKPYDVGYLLKAVEKAVTFRRLRLVELQHHEDLKRAVEERTRELQKAHALLLQSEKMALVGQIAAGVAHEINNPLGFISCNLESLRKFSEKILVFLALQSESIAQYCPVEELTRIDELRTKAHINRIAEEIPEMVTESLEGVGRIKEIVSNLKGFARVDDKEFVSTSVNETIKKALNIVRNELKYVATIDTDFGDIAPLKCLPNQLAQVFMNLLVNAAQAIEGHGDIRIRTWQDDGNVFASISDSGCGIPDEVKGRIFEPFFTTKEVGKGTGLGLPICYDIIHKHSGEILVSSIVGTGTVFTVRLPLDHEQ
jgi:signal transduction histidine kinase